MTRDELIRPWSDDELRKLPSESGKQFEGPNPFAAVTDHPTGLQNAKRWSFFHNDRGQKMEEVPPPSERTPFDSMELKMSTRRAGFYRHENPENGNVAMFPSVPVYRSDDPRQRVLEDEWEQRSIEMHHDQVAVVLDPLSPEGFRYVQPNQPDEPMAYHDYVKMVEAERRQKAEAKDAKKDGDDKDDGDGKPGLKRGD